MIFYSWRAAIIFSILVSLSFSGHAQVDSETPIRRGRVHLYESDWRTQKSDPSSVRFDGGVRLRRGATEAQVTSAPVELPFAVNGVGPHWDAAIPEGAALDFELRTRGRDGSWSKWIPIGHETPIPPVAKGTNEALPYAGDISGELLLTPSDTRYVQVRLTLRNPESRSLLLRRLSLYLVNATKGPSAPPDRRTSSDSERATADTTEPRIYSRTEWDAMPPTEEYRHARATHLAIHHTATARDGTADTWEECAAGVRAIQDFHMNERGWIDIGYNYLVCQTGAIFQGREDGNDARDVVGAHDGYNEGSVGTAGLGYFHPPQDQSPTSALIDGFVDLFNWIATRRQIDPDETDFYAGYGQRHRTVYGHREIGATACPGDGLYSKRSRIVDRLVGEGEADPPSTTTLSANAPNPAQSVTHFDLALARDASVTLTVYDLLGRRVATRNYGPLSAGDHTVSVQTASWAAGAYFYRLKAGQKTAAGRIQVVH